MAGPISLKSRTLRYAAAYMLLVMATGGAAVTGVRLWQMSSDESLRLQLLAAEIQDMRGAVYRQTKALFDFALLEDVYARGQYRHYALEIDRQLDTLGAQSRSDAERTAVRALRESYRQVTERADRILEGPLPFLRESRREMLETDFESDLLRNYELATARLSAVFAAEQAQLRGRLEAVSRYVPWVVGIPLAAAVGLFVMTNMFIRRSFIRPLSSLIDATVGLSFGQLDRHVPEIGALELQRIARAINAMASDLARSQDALVQAERQATLGALVPVVAHNIRNPLASIRALAQVIDEPHLPPETRESLADIIAATDRLERWTESLLSYLNPLQPQRAETDLAGLVDEVLQLLAPNIAVKRIVVQRRDWAHDCRVSLDARLFEQAVHGLLLNAIDASPPGGLLGLSLTRRSAGVRLEIADQGAGIAFTPGPGGFKPGPTTKRMGTGLGIPFALKVCELHGGSVEYERLPGSGTRVTVNLPLEVLPHGDSLATA